MQQSNHKYTNSLINETSPYLLSHAHNPVDWNAWGETVLEKAKSENKPLIISVGYAACHWCHVMERESFEDETVAEIMNDGFISIKVDREERPDVDQIYMNAVMLISNRGGWPLNAIALPDGRPIFAGTYFPKDRWILLLKQISELWKNNPEKLIEQAEAITQGIRRSEVVSLAEGDSDFQSSEIELITDGILENMDFNLGGQSGAPKFPMPVGLDFLMQYSFFEKNDRALEAVKITLDQMAMGGIYDQIGGGFARYSVDEFWLVPHFEKMLYDNAQLVSLYSKAYQLTKNDLYKNVVYETIDFIEQELTSPEGAFYSALDADSEGEEGKYYIWHQHELEDLLEEDAEFVSSYFNTTQTGNWEHGKNILHRKLSAGEFVDINNLKPEVFNSKLNHSKSLMLKYRENRVKPALDDKILTAWNALMINGLIDAYRVFGDQKFLSTAIGCTEFILENCYDDSGLLHRNFKNGRSSINGFLDDYAFLIDALINLYQATFNEKWLNLANDLADYTTTHFFDKASGMFFYTSDLDPALIARKMEIADNVIPSSNSAMAWNLFRLGKYFDDETFIKKANQMLLNIKKDLTRGGIYYSNWSNLMLKFIHDPYEVAITGTNAQEFRLEMEKHYLPNVLFVGSNKKSDLPLLMGKFSDKETMIYICENKTCRKPNENVKEAIDSLK